MNSIRRRLMLPLAGLYALGWLGTAIYAYYQARHEVGELFDQELIVVGQTLHALVRHEVLEEEEPMLPISNLPLIGESEHAIAFQLVIGDHLVSSSTDLDQEINAPPGLADITVNGRLWRVYTLLGPTQGFRLHVLEPLRIREELGDSITLSLVAPLLLVIPGLLLLSWLIIGDALRPLRRIGEAVESRSPKDLTPIDDRTAPREIHALVGAINRLLKRLDGAFSRERRFTADAAHELRTPLAALKTQSQIANRARSADERRHALEQIEQGVERSTHLIEQLLTLARLEPEATESADTGPVVLCPIISDCVAALYPEALKKRIDLGVQHCGCKQVPIIGNATAIEILLHNIIGNAIRYTPEGGRIDIRTRLESDHVLLGIADNGPGIASEQRRRVFDRFYRATEHHAIQGSGLGLSIVARIAELHQASIELRENKPHGGLDFIVRFPIVTGEEKKEPAGEGQARKR